MEAKYGGEIRQKTSGHVEHLGGVFLPYLPPYFSSPYFGSLSGHFQKYGGKYGVNTERFSLESMGLIVVHQKQKAERGREADMTDDTDRPTI